MVTMVCPEGSRMTAVAVGKMEYKVGRDGRVKVQDDHVEALRAHGLVPGDEVDAIETGSDGEVDGKGKDKGKDKGAGKDK